MQAKQNKNEFLRIVKKYLDGNATEQEKTFLIQYYGHFENDPDITEELSEKEIKNLEVEINDGIWQRINSKPAARIIYTGRRWFKVAAAIAILLSLSVVYYVWHNSRRQSQPVVIQPLPVSNDIAPGGNKATLRLADGRIIVLDSMQDGKLAQEGATQIVKTGDGELAYNISGSGEEETFYNTIEIPKGGQYQVTLPDGTKVWLNSASSLRFPAAFTGTQRNVELTGEAYFEVSQNAAMPFIVTVGNMSVQVLGTHFNINAYSDEPAIKTTLLKGSVKVRFDNREKVLLPGQQAIASTHSLQVVTDVNEKQVTAWKNGRFYFINRDLRSILRQAARWYDAEIIYENPLNENYTVMVNRDVPLSRLLRSIEETGGVHFTIEGKKVIVKP